MKNKKARLLVIMLFVIFVGGCNMANDYGDERPDESETATEGKPEEQNENSDSALEEYEATREDILDAFWDN